MKLKLLFLGLVSVAFTTVVAQCYTQEESYSILDSVGKNNAYVVDLAKQALQKNPKCSDAYYALGMVYENEQNYRAALEAFSQAIRYASKKSAYSKGQAYVWRGYVYEEIEDYASAEADYNAAVKQKSMMGYYFRAQFYLKQGDFAAAEKDFKVHLENKVNDTEILSNYVVCLMSQGKFDAALDYLNERIRFEPTFYASYYVRAYVYYYINESVKAIDDLLIYLAHNPTTSDIIWDILESNIDYSISKISERISVNPKDEYWLWARMALYRDSEQFAAALNDLQIYENLFGETRYTHSNKAICYNGLYDFSNEVKQWTAFIGDPEANTDFAYYARGIAYRNCGQTERALLDFDSTLMENPAFSAVYGERAWTYEMLGRLDEALKDINLAISYSPEKSWLYCRRGAILRQKGDSVSAQNDFRKVLELDTVSGNAATALAMLGRGDEAVALMKNILADSDDVAGDQYNLACLYSLLNRKEEAVAALRAAVDAGYKNYYHISLDTDLVNIREEQGYKDILNSITQKKVSDLFQSVKQK